MQITHEEARRLIQFDFDEALNVQEKTALFMHLKECIECRLYAEEIKAVVNILPSILKRQWNLQPIPLSPRIILAKRNPKTHSVILTTRKMVIGIVFLALIFSAWQFALSSGQGYNSLPPVGILPIPTPSVQSTSTKSMLQQNCDEMLYVVQAQDTLESIAQRFAVAKEEIITINNMKTEAIQPMMKLIIPICSFTPTGTVTLFSTTYTPSIRPTTSTPGTSG